MFKIGQSDEDVQCESWYLRGCVCFICELNGPEVQSNVIEMYRITFGPVLYSLSYVIMIYILMQSLQKYAFF